VVQREKEKIMKKSPIVGREAGKQVSGNEVRPDASGWILSEMG
jgi:hypothetical protein